MDTPPLLQTFPLRLLIGSEDCTFLLSDGATFSNSDPGGFEAASFQIPRDMPNTLRGQRVRIDCGLDVAWEGRVSQVQRSLGNRTQIMCEGYKALLADDVASMVFVDRDLTRWQDPSLTRQLAVLALNFSLASAQVAPDQTSLTPALAQIITDAWASPNKPLVESWYDSGPENLIGKLWYDLYWPTSDANWNEVVLTSSDANATTTLSSGNLRSTVEVTGYFTPASAYRFALLQHFYNATPGGTSGAQFTAFWKNMAVYGNHGLTGRGSDPVGFYPSDIFGWCQGQIPGLQRGVIPLTDASGYVMAHSVYYTPVGLDQIVGDMATAQGWHWGVWASLSPLTGDTRPRADFRPRPAAGQVTAFCMRQDCETLDIREDLTNQYNQAVVSYTDIAGAQQAVIVAADNPVLDQAGIPLRTLILSGGTMTAATAAVFGAQALQLTNVQDRVSGSIDIIAPIGNPNGPMAPWMLKAGIDRLRIGDLPSTDAFGAYNDVPINRVECSLSTSGVTASVEVGSGANLVESVQARLTAATFLSAQGG